MQAGGDVDGTTMVLAERSWDTVGSVGRVLTELLSSKGMSAETWWA